MFRNCWPGAEVQRTSFMSSKSLKHISNVTTSRSTPFSRVSDLVQHRSFDLSGSVLTQIAGCALVGLRGFGHSHHGGSSCRHLLDHFSFCTCLQGLDGAFGAGYGLHQEKQPAMVWSKLRFPKERTTKPTVVWFWPIFS